MLEIEGLSVSRGGRRVVDGVSFRARAGEVLVVLGPNGAGKSTVLEAMIGLVPVDAGVVRYEGERLETFRERAGVFAYMPDEAELAEETTVAIALGGRAELGEIARRRGGTLSRGEEKRAWLAWALGMGRAVAVLDEPFGAFDPIQLDDAIATTRAEAEKGMTIIATVHQMNVAERVADRVVLLAEGRVVASGTPTELGPLEEAFRAHVART